jgi:hypothetical protein
MKIGLSDSKLDTAGVWSIRPSRVSNSAATTRERGASDVSVLAACSRFDARDRWFRHEAPLDLPGLNLRLLRDGVSPHDVDQELLERIGRDIHQYSDVMARLRASTSERKTIQVTAEAVRSAFVDPGIEDAPESLIYRIAREDRGRLAELCIHPRELLRRERRLVSVDRSRQLDAQSMRWLDRQPGEDLIQKAGSRQWIQAVVRYRSPDTLENRVLKDCLLRAVGAAREYRQENLRFAQSQAVKKVERFESSCESLALTSAVSRVPAVVGIPVPNYVLQNDPRYKHLWSLWLQLVRREIVSQSLVNWAGRWISELGFVSTLAAMSELCENDQRWSQHLWLRSEPVNGEFLDPAAPVGGSLLHLPSAVRIVDLVRGGQLARAAWPGSWQGIVNLAPDFMLIPRGDPRNAVAAWSCVLWNEQLTERFGAALQRLDERLRQLGVRGSMTVLAPAHVSLTNLSTSFVSVDQFPAPQAVMSQLGDLVVQRMVKAMSGAR